MTEVIRFSKIGIDDLSLGSGSFEARLADERIVAKEQVNVRRLAPSLADGRVLFLAANDLGDNANFTFDTANNDLYVPGIIGGDDSGDDLTLESTAHATKGDVLIQPNGGNVGIGLSSPDSELHIAATGTAALKIENVSAVSTGDPLIIFTVAATNRFAAGVDDSDSDKFKIVRGGVLGTTPSIVIDASGLVAINHATPAGSLHIQTNSSGGASPSTASDDLVIENNVSGGLSILTPNTTIGSIRFGDPQSDTAGAILYDHSTDNMSFQVASTTVLTIDGAKILQGDTANANNTSGLTINQAGFSDEILSFKATAPNHGVTDSTETDTWAQFRKISSSTGGLQTIAISTGTTGNRLVGVGGTPTTTKTGASGGYAEVDGLTYSGTSLAAAGADENVFVVKSSTTLMIVDAEGDIHVNGSTTLQGPFDDYDDIALLSAVRQTVLAYDSKKSLEGFLDEEREILIRHKVISEGGFLSLKGFCGLVVDAFRQLDGRLKTLDARISGQLPGEIP